MMVSPACTRMVQHFEGCKLKAYPDPGTGGAPWTVGWGATGRDIGRGTEWTQAQADGRLARDLAMFAAGVSHMIGNQPTSQHQFDAMVCFAYNVGLDDNHDGIAQGLGDSTLLKKHLAHDYVGAQAEFAKWNKAAGEVMPGLTRRRGAEAALYGTPDNHSAPVLL